VFFTFLAVGRDEGLNKFPSVLFLTFSFVKLTSLSYGLTFTHFHSRDEGGDDGNGFVWLLFLIFYLYDLIYQEVGSFLESPISVCIFVGSNTPPLEWVALKDLDFLRLGRFSSGAFGRLGRNYSWRC